MLKTKLAAAAAAVAMSTALLAMPASASSFKSLEGIDAQEMSVEDLQAITGELNAYDIAASLYTLATNAKNPRLAAYYQKLADWTLANAVKINATFTKFGVFTECTNGCYLVPTP